MKLSIYKNKESDIGMELEGKDKEVNIGTMLNIDNPMTNREQLGLVWKLSLPAILTQITSIVMQYIDAGIVGQSIGAGKKDAAKKFGWMTVLFGMSIMAVTGTLMYIFSPFMMSILTPVYGLKGVWLAMCVELCVRGIILLIRMRKLGNGDRPQSTQK